MVTESVKQVLDQRLFRCKFLFFHDKYSTQPTDWRQIIVIFAFERQFHGTRSKGL